jgi:hypothetical protein
MTEAINTSPVATITETKFSAAQIEGDCPVMLQDLGKLIAVHSEKAKKCENKADQHYNTIARLLATAYGACDEIGFTAFQQKFIPDLGKSRVHELLQIGNNKKSVEETRADTRARVAKHRANKKADLQVRYGNGHSEPDAEGALNETGEIEASNISSGQTSEPSKSRRSVAPGDDAQRWFDARVLLLDRTTEGRSPDRFSKTSVPREVLERVGNRLINTAKHKKNEPVGSTPGESECGTVQDDQPADDAEAERPVLDAEELRP